MQAHKHAPASSLQRADLGDRFTAPKPFARLSEHSIANRYAFRHVYGFRLSAREPEWLEGVSRASGLLATPLDLAASPRVEVVRRFLDAGFAVGPFEADRADRLLEALGPDYLASSDRTQSDYLYDLADIAALAGPSRAKARQYGRQLRRAPSFAAVRFMPEHAAAARHVAHEWRRRVPARDGDDDMDAARDAIDLAEAGLLDGVAVFSGGAMAGFILVDGSIEDMLVALILKTATAAAGVTDVCFQEACRLYPSKRYLNTCQDLGLSGLRARKQRMGPCAIVEKTYLTRR